MRQKSLSEIVSEKRQEEQMASFSYARERTIDEGLGFERCALCGKRLPLAGQFRICNFCRHNSKGGRSRKWRKVTDNG